MVCFVGKRVKNLIEYRLADDGIATNDIIHVGATGTIQDADENWPSIEWDHLPKSSPFWCTSVKYLQFIED